MKESAALVEAFRNYDDADAIDEEDSPSPDNETKAHSNASPAVTPLLKHKRVDVDGSISSIPKAIYTIDSQGMNSTIYLISYITTYSRILFYSILSFPVINKINIINSNFLAISYLFRYSIGPSSPRSVHGSYRGTDTEMISMVQQAEEIRESHERDHLL